MNFEQATYIIIFYAVFSAMGLIGWPLAKLFTSSRILKYSLSKMLGLISFGYLIWILGYFKILSFQNLTAVYILFFGAILSATFANIIQFGDKSKTFKQRALSWLSSLKNNLSWMNIKYFVVAEALILLLLFAYLWLRSMNSAINGTERFMDLALMNASSKTDWFPFIDSWYAGKTVNYYYYGSYLMSLISNLGQIPVVVAYNIALGWLYVQSVFLSGSLVYSKTKSIFLALVAAFLITSAGTLFYSSCVLRAGSDNVTSSGHSCGYASSTRLYTPSYIINEIPSYSFTVGDLHAHMLALPFFITILILILGALSRIEDYQAAKKHKQLIILASALGLAVATAAMINAWDGVTSAALLASIVVLKLLQIKYLEKLKNGRSVWQTKLKPFTIFSGIGLIATLVFMLPSLLKFQSPVLGVYFIPSYVARYNLSDVQWPTPITALVGMWGIFFVAIAGVIYAKRKTLAEYFFPVLLGFVSLGIIVGVELFFIHDIYGVSNPPYFRANTTFKFGYHAWTMLCIAFCLFLAGVRTVSSSEKKGWIHKYASVILSVAVLGGLFYPYKAINEFYLTSLSKKTLDGSAWMKSEMPDDLNVINYINSNLKTRAVIAEAVGDSYTTYARISSYTGMIAPMGWKTHEWTWRFDKDAAKKAEPREHVETGYAKVSEVAEDISSLYQSPSLESAKLIIDKYKIEYIYVGNLERQAYSGLNEQIILQTAKSVFTSGDSVLYKVE